MNDYRKLADVLEFAEDKEEYIEERRIKFDDLQLLCYRMHWGNKVDSAQLNGFIWIVSKRLYLSTEDIMSIARMLKRWSDDGSSLLFYANAIAGIAKSKIYTVPTGEDDESRRDEE